jgi:hypothetical protein
MKTPRQQNLFKKVEDMFNKVNIDGFIRKTLHLKKAKKSIDSYKLGKRGLTQVKTPSKMEMEVIDAFS